MTESIQKQCNVSDNKYIYSIFSDLALPPKSDSKSTALSAGPRGRTDLKKVYYSKIEEGI